MSPSRLTPLDENGTIPVIPYCVDRADGECDGPAHFGEGVDLRKGKLGVHRCFRHWKEHNADRIAAASAAYDKEPEKWSTLL